jgi:hypothetical protein
MIHSKFSFAPRSPSLLTPPIENPITGIAAYWPMPACCSAGLFSNRSN